MTASFPDTRTSTQRPVGAWVSLAVFTVVALAFATSPWWAYDTAPGTTTTTGLVLFGLAVLTVPLCTWSLRLRTPVNQVTAAGDSLQVRLDNHLLVSVTVLCLVWTAFLVWAAVTAGIAGAGLFVLVLALPFAALLPDTVRAVTRQPRLTLGPDKVSFRGWSTEAELRWDDLATVQLVAPHVRRPVIRLLARSGAGSYLTRSRKLLVSIDLPNQEPAIDVPLLTVAAPGRLIALLETVARSTPEVRGAWIGQQGRQFLTSTTTAAPHQR